ncbi:MAG: hypothetical protein IKA99_00115 [Clostridia bacterium]|nr:hypothetical protein [Clostridia bacterium]
MIYNIFNFLYNDFSKYFLEPLGYTLAPDGYLLISLFFSILILGIFALYYTFRSIGLYKMAKNSHLDKPALSIIPFFGIYYCYKLSPNSKYVKKQPAIYILAIITGAMILLANCLLDFIYAIPAIFRLVELNKAMLATGKFYIVSESIFGFDSTFGKLLNGYLSLVDIAFAVFMLILYSRLFMSYTINKSTKYVFFTAGVYVGLNIFILPGINSFLLAGILIFALRNKPSINYDAYIEARRQWAQRNPYGGNPYGGNPYNNGQNYGGYNQPNNGGYTGREQRDIDPFEEFNSSNSNKNSNSKDTDDFFS